jgi:hypothetical protein
MTPAETRDDENILHVATLSGADVRYSTVDEYILLQLRVDGGEEVWVRFTRANFTSFARYLGDEVQRLEQ